MSESKLNSGQKHLLKLLAEGINADGWARISELLYPMFKKEIPSELIVLEKLNKGAKAKFSEKGSQIYMAMKYL